MTWYRGKMPISNICILYQNNLDGIYLWSKRPKRLRPRPKQKCLEGAGWHKTSDEIGLKWSKDAILLFLVQIYLELQIWTFEDCPERLLQGHIELENSEDFSGNPIHMSKTLIFMKKIYYVCKVWILLEVTSLRMKLWALEHFINQN